MAADTRMTQLLDAVDRLAPAIEAMRRRIERERRLPEELVGNLRAAGVFHLWLARSLGGPELNAVCADH